MIHIVVEGPAAAGKTTLIEKLTARLEKDGMTVLTHKEPTHSPYGKALRRHYKICDRLIDEEEEALLFMKDRMHSEEIVVRLDQRYSSAILLQDRNYLSSVVYQKASIQHEFRRWALPNLFVLLCPPVDVLEKRIKERGSTGKERYINLSFIRKNYISCAEWLRTHQDFATVFLYTDQEHEEIVESVSEATHALHSF